MAREFAKGFYNSKEWQRCRAAYKASVGGLCERCLANGLIVPGAIVHHKTYINPDTITDPSVLTNFSNLELLCRDCHAKEHAVVQKRYRVDKFGKVHVPQGA